MMSPNRTILCKLQTELKKPKHYVYILYSTIDHLNVPTRRGARDDFAGLFDNKEDAEKVAECLTNLFSKLQSDEWRMGSPYTVWDIYFKHGIFVSAPSAPVVPHKYGVIGVFASIHPLSYYRTQQIHSVSSTEHEAQTILNNLKQSTSNKLKIIKYRVNDIVPTVFLDDYVNTKTFKHVMNELKEIPKSQHSRRNLRRNARESKLIQYSDSSDSEDESRYKSVTSRSLST